MIQPRSGCAARKGSHPAPCVRCDGSTLQGLARACVAQFEKIHVDEKFWPLVRSEKQLDRVIQDIQNNPGPVFFTLVDQKMRRKLRSQCDKIGVPCLPILDPLIKAMSSYTGEPAIGIPGLQHALDEEYFYRVDAVDFALSFDDGQNFNGIDEADVVLVGVSRTSKTPTCIYLARRGIKAANIPFVLHAPPPDHILKLKRPVLSASRKTPNVWCNCVNRACAPKKTHSATNKWPKTPIWILKRSKTRLKPHAP